MEVRRSGSTGNHRHSGRRTHSNLGKSRGMDGTTIRRPGRHHQPLDLYARRTPPSGVDPPQIKLPRSGGAPPTRDRRFHPHRVQMGAKEWLRTLPKLVVCGGRNAPGTSWVWRLDLEGL